jgi:DNA polymerase III subunit gamma/tau
MGKALYRTFRPTSFDTVLGQDHVTTTLKNSIKQGTISHAYLLTGPRGVGKTSVARILAHAVNDLPYEDENPHIDIVEIDAASNRRIDEIRELRERVHISPTSAKYKVYIIDEVHMLTKEAFNALLKTLEEPPAHVIFILATTEFHKLPDTIVSRCLRLSFKPISVVDIVAHLQTIANQEKLNIKDEALQLIAQHGDGSFRDSISLLDQVRNSGKVITAATVEQMLGRVPETAINAILSAVETGDAAALLQQLSDLYSRGASENELAKQLGEAVRSKLVTNQPGLAQADALTLLRGLLGVPAATQPKAQLELVLLEVLLPQQPITVPHTKPLPALREEALPDIGPLELPPEIAAAIDPEPLPPVTPVLSEQIAGTDELWQAILQALKTTNNTLYGVARMARVGRSESSLVLAFEFAFHYKKLNDAKNKKILEDILRSKSAEALVLEITHEPKTTPVSEPRAVTITKAPDQAYESISNIFGSPEVLES